MKIKLYKRYIEFKRWENDFIYFNILKIFNDFYNDFKYIIIFLDNKILRLMIYLFLNKKIYYIFSTF